MTRAVRDRDARTVDQPPASSPAGLGDYDVLIGLPLAAAESALAGWRVGRDALRPVVRFALRPPLVPARLQPLFWLQARARLGAVYRLRVTALLQEAVPAVVDVVLDRIDLTSIVLERVKLDEIIDEVDVNDVVERVDLTTVIDRIDLPAVAKETIDGIDLPEIIRGSTGIMTSEAVVGIRMQAIRADEYVRRIIDRLLLRHGARENRPRPSIGAHNQTEC
ncbi:MAG TPA: hypothetical protein VE441_14085 [Mycobacterium sp.]|nr:hypothetical protein [Mycobacterium sp.]